MERNLNGSLGSNRGFTLIEIAVVMVIIGILAGGSVSLIRVLSERKGRNETADYLKQVNQTLISFADINGRFPWADTNGDGVEDVGSSSGDLPFLTIQINPNDPYGRNLGYAVNTNMTTGNAATCNALRAGVVGQFPQVVDSSDSTGTPFSVAAIIISAGLMDGNGDGDVFDAIASGTWQGNNTNGSPNYIRHFPTDSFDDLVAYVGGNELYGEICEYLVLAVNNTPTSTTVVFVHDFTQGTDLGSINIGNTATFNVISGTQILILDASGGGGNIVGSTPPTPISLAGTGHTIMIP